RSIGGGSFVSKRLALRLNRHRPHYAHSVAKLLTKRRDPIEALRQAIIDKRSASHPVKKTAKRYEPNHQRNIAGRRDFLERSQRMLAIVRIFQSSGYIVLKLDS